MRRAGFSLVETLIAAMLALAVLALVGGAWPAYSRAAAKNSANLCASMLASEEMEVAIQQGYAGVTPRQGDVVVSQTVAGQNVDTSYHYQVSVADVNATLRSVQVRVSWKDSHGNQEIMLETLLASS